MSQSTENESSLDTLRAALKTDVIDVLRREIPTLRSMTRVVAYEAVMNQPTLLDASFKLFRDKPHLFRSVTTDPGTGTIAADTHVLPCGNSIADVIALVVRAAARRYFRSRLGGAHRIGSGTPRRRPSLLHALARTMGLGRADTSPHRRHATAADTPAERLYRTLREHLRYEWQALLIPHYAPLPPHLVTRLGPRLLDIREPVELRALASAAAAPLAEQDERPPLLLDTAMRLITRKDGTIESETLWRVCQQMDLGRLFPSRDAAALRRAVAQVAATRREVLTLLMPAIGQDIRHFTAFLMIAYRTLSETRFRQAFCDEGQLAMARRWAERLAQTPPPPPRLEDMRHAYFAILSTAPAEPTRLPQRAQSNRMRQP
jgi:hypothetical protein